MLPFQRQHFICSAIEQCRETTNCCVHKTPHIKDERCVPRECRYAPGADSIDCDPFDPANPRAPVPVKTPPAKTVEQRMKEIVGEQPVQKAIEEESAKVEQDAKGLGLDVTLVDEPEKAAQELGIKEAVKKAQKKGPGKKKVPEKQS